MPSGSKKRKAAKKTPKQGDFLAPTDPPASEGSYNGQAEADQEGEREPVSPKTPDRGMEYGEEEEEEEGDARGGAPTREEAAEEEGVIIGTPLPPQTPAQQSEPDDRGRQAGEWVEVVSDDQQQQQQHEASQEANEVAVTASAQEASQEANEAAITASAQEGDGAEAADGDEASAPIGDPWENLTPVSTADGEPAAMASQQGEGSDGDREPVMVAEQVEVPVEEEESDPKAEEKNQGRENPVSIVADESPGAKEGEDAGQAVRSEVTEPEAGEPAPEGPKEEASDDAVVIEESAHVSAATLEADEPGPVPEEAQQGEEDPGMKEAREVEEAPVTEEEAKEQTEPRLAMEEAPEVEEAQEHAEEAQEQAEEAQDQAEPGPASTEEPREVTVAVDSEAAVMGDAEEAGPAEEADAAVTEEEDGAAPEPSSTIELEAEPSAVEVETEPVHPVIDDTEPVVEEIEPVQPAVDETEPGPPAIDDTEPSFAMEESEPTPAVVETEPMPGMEETEPSTVMKGDAELAPPAEEPQEDVEPSLATTEAEVLANVEQTEATPADEEAGLSASDVEPSVDVADEGEQPPASESVDVAEAVAADEDEPPLASESDDPLCGLEGASSAMEDANSVAPSMDQSDEPAAAPTEEIAQSSESVDPLHVLEGAFPAQEDDNLVAPSMDQSDEPVAAPTKEIAPSSGVHPQVEGVDLASVGDGSEAIQIVAPQSESADQNQLFSAPEGDSLAAEEQEAPLDAGVVEIPFVVSEEEVAEILGEDEEAHPEAEASSVPVEKYIATQVDESLFPARDEAEFALESGLSGEVGVALTPMESDKGGGDETSGAVEREMLSNGPSACTDEGSTAEMSAGADASEEAVKEEHVQDVPEISYTGVDTPIGSACNSEQHLHSTAVDDRQQEVVHHNGGEIPEEAPPAVEHTSVVQEEDFLKQEQSVSSAYEEIRALSTELIGNSTLEGPKEEPLQEEPIEDRTQEEPTQNGLPEGHSFPEATYVQGEGVTETTPQDGLSPPEEGPEAKTAVQMHEAGNVKAAGEEEQRLTVVAAVENSSHNEPANVEKTPVDAATEKSTASHNELANVEKAPVDAATEKSTAIIEVYRNEKTLVNADNQQALVPVTEKDVHVDQRSLEQKDVAAARALGTPIVVAQKSNWWGCCGLLDALLNRT